MPSARALRCDRLRIKLNDHNEIGNSALRLTKLQPSKMAIEVGMRISRILSDPFGYNLKMALWIGSQKFVEHLYFFRRRRFFHCFTLIHLRLHRICVRLIRPQPSER